MHHRERRPSHAVGADSFQSYLVACFPQNGIRRRGVKMPASVATGE